MAALVVHFLLLAFLSHQSAQRFTRGRGDALVVAIVLAWSNIVLTSLLLSTVELLGQPGWFFRTSVLIGLVGWWCANRWVNPPVEPTAPTAADKINKPLLVFVLTTLGVILGASVWISVVYPPNNYDSLTYHLPRVLYYIGQDSLQHFDTGNPRQTYFPFNYNLLQLACLVYGSGWKVVTLVNVLSWISAGLMVHRISRHCGLNFNTSLVAAWVALISTQVLAQASSTTNDLPTATALLATILCGQRWLKTRAGTDALLAGIAGGLTIGTKLTVVFFGPAAVVLIALGLFRQAQAERGMRGFGPLLVQWILPVACALVLALPFVVFNLTATGEWMTTRYDFTLNRPFSWGAAWQTGEAYTLQFFLEPLHRFTWNPEVTGRLNDWASSHLFANWNSTFAFSPLYVFPPDLNEDHVWFGYTGPLIVLCALWVFLRDWRLRQPVSWLALLGLGWFIAYFLLNKWSLYIQRYFVPPVLVMAPCVAAALAAAGRGGFIQRWAVRTPFILTILCTLWFGGHYLVKNTNRPLEPLLAGDNPKPPYPALPIELVRALRDQTDVNIDTYGGNERIFLLMNIGHRARFTAHEEIDPAKYNVLSHWGFVRYNLYANIASFSSYQIIDFPNKPTAGVAPLGTFGHGTEAWDYWGLPPHANETPADDRNRKVQFTIFHSATEPDRYAESRLKVVGLNPADHARLDVFIRRPDDSREFLQSFTATGFKPGSITGEFTGLVLELRDEASNELISSAVLPYGTLQAMPDTRPLPSANALFVSDCIQPGKRLPVEVDGLASLEGPYDEWSLPQFRWAKKPVVRLEIPPTRDLKTLRVTLGIRLQVRLDAALGVYHNGTLVDRVVLHGHHEWFDRVVDIPAADGTNVIELRDIPPFEVVDTDAYLAQHPEVADELRGREGSLEDAVKEHFETVGRAQGWELPMKVGPFQPDPPVESLYFIFRTLQIEGLTE